MRFSQFKIMPFVLLAVLLVLQYRLWLQPGGISDWMQLRKQAAAEKQINEKLKKRNAVLLNQVQHLQNNNQAIESRARQELGMIKKDETFYQVVDQ